ncbi:hypothetical protein L915_19702 [Plasmopara halstedii]|uniref:PX domain-containing protein n=1 Tax=Plasmopara halstedii TaxID=4781 RepID=A0A0P1B923_PLAHL|nr:hypothetical protein L915_19702 [Plasmopara halstedii]CEG50351.1 hypothetical protein L915_19702 [Plasmopara halstedii]|eukprot:XP_024586720.1 hypothetical protein L915_19702 [Plasmopara halstedii]
MASDKRPILSECDSDEDPERKQQQQKREDSNSSAKTAGSQSEEEIDPVIHNAYTDFSGNMRRVERRFSEFVACAAEINTRLESNRAARCCTRLENEESKDEVFEPFKWELPAKTWFRVTQKNALEERRAQLESSMETLLLQDDRRICRLPVLRDFLMLDIFGVQVTEQKNFEAAQPFE